MEKELEIQRSLVVDSEGEIELLIEEKQNLSEYGSIVITIIDNFCYQHS